MTAVCIAGMHRSGTSLVARALNLSGLFLGSEEDIVVTAPDNIEGFWENQKFLKLNDQILGEYRGAWDVPPPFPIDWEKTSDMFPYHMTATHLVGHFKDRKFWGWKDPRNSLTIDFWKSVLPKMKVVICIRNPVEVAQSLSRRGYTSYPFGFNLWFAYNHRLLSSILPENRIVTHFDSYFYNPRAELVRLVDFLGIPATTEQIDVALNSINLPLRHNHFSLYDLLDQSPSNELVELYQQLCLEAGPVYDECSGGSPVIPNYSAENYRKYKTSSEKLMSDIAEKEHMIQMLNNQLKEKEHMIQMLDNQLKEKEKEKEKEVQRLTDLHSSLMESRSWQITKPLRWIGGFLRGMKREK